MQCWFFEQSINVSVCVWFDIPQKSGPVLIFSDLPRMPNEHTMMLVQVIEPITAARCADDTYSHTFDTMESLHEDVIPLPQKARQQMLRANHD